MQRSAASFGLRWRQLADRLALVLEDGFAVVGERGGSVGWANGEVVFNTCMSGYQEVLSDPSYAGQIVVMTYPLIGNTGVTAYFSESARPWVRALVTRQLSRTGDHWRAAGGRTARLRFGHHGGNHPVIDLRSGRASITSQNHEFQVLADSIPAESGFEVSHRSLHDGSVEGLTHRRWPVRSVQFHLEGSPGPQDNQPLFDEFLALAAGRSKSRLTPLVQAPDSA